MVSGFPRRTCRFTAVVVVATSALVACGSDEPEATPASSPTVAPTVATQPAPTATIAHIEGDPRDFVIRRGDLPAGFAEPVGEYQAENVYSIAHLRLQGLTEQDPSRTHLLGVLSSVGIYESVEVATAEFDVEEIGDTEAVEREISQATTGVTDISVAPTAVSFDGVDRALGFRIMYSAGGIGVVGYRYRFAIRNAVATLSVIARAPEYPDEPAELPEVANEIALRQIAHLTGS